MRQADWGRKSRRLVAVALIPLLVAVACSSDGSSEISSGLDGPVATTPPLAIPPVLEQGSNTLTAPTTAAIAVPTTSTPATSTPEPEATAVPPTSVAEDTAEQADPTAAPTTAVPPTAVPAADAPTVVSETPGALVTTAPVATDASPATAVPQATAVVPAPTATVEATAAPVAPSGQAISLGDFEVVNLLTGDIQNIAELSPSGPTMLWFWAPH